VPQVFYNRREQEALLQALSEGQYIKRFILLLSLTISGNFVKIRLGQDENSRIKKYDNKLFTN